MSDTAIKINTFHYLINSDVTGYLTFLCTLLRISVYIKVTIEIFDS